MGRAMSDLWQHLKQRKLVQWAVAYAAAAFALLQGMDMVGQKFGWPDSIGRILIIASCVGFFITLVLAWYHGERGQQKVPATELFLLALLLVVGCGLLWKFAPGATDHALTAATQPASAVEAKPAAAIPAKSIAVLPFENLSGDKGNEYFVAGMQDLILTKLADIGDLKVISRTSTKKYASRPDDLKTIARQLGVATILEGSVQKAGDQVLINVQLIDANTDGHLWAESYTRDLKNIFGVEGEVAGKVADALKAKLSPDETSAVASIPTRNPQAYTLYLKAQYAWDQYNDVDRQPAHLLQATEFLNQAIAQDAKFAGAYALLSRVQSRTVAGHVESANASFAKAEANARKALALQPDLAEAHFALATALLNQEHYAQALPELQTAARLKPGDSDIAIILAEVQWGTSGDLQQMSAAMDNALLLDPRNGSLYVRSAQMKILLREYVAARQTLERGLAIRPDNQRLRWGMAQLMLLMGDPAGARAQLAQLPANGRGVPGLIFQSWVYSRDYAQALKAAGKIPRRNIYADAGDRQSTIGIAAQLSGDTTGAKAAFDQARSAIEKALQEHPDSTEMRQKLAGIEMWTGQRNAALQLVDKVLHERQAQYRKMREHLLHAENAQSHGPGLDPMLASASTYELRAEILAHFGDANGATELLERLFATQGTGDVISPALLRLDPIWDPIRKDPAFQALLKEHSHSAPATASSAAEHD